MSPPPVDRPFRVPPRELRLPRRAFLGAALAAPLLPTPAQGADGKGPLGLGFSLYGMRSLPTAKAVAACADAGYDCVELAVMKDWPADSMSLSGEARAALRREADSHGVRISAIMENLPIFGDDAAHQRNLRRIQLAGEVAHDVSQQERPVMETILGGKPAQWNSVRELMGKRLEDWAAAAEKAKIVVAIKAHVGGAMHLPEHPARLVKQIGSPWIRAAYDFSHFQLRNVDLEQSLKTLAPVSEFVHVKDAAGDPSRVRFLLPGQGDIDYVRLLTLLVEHGYRRDVFVEVSGQIHGKPGYDPVAAARSSYAPLAQAMQKAGIARE